MDKAEDSASEQQARLLADALSKSELHHQVAQARLAKQHKQAIAALCQGHEQELNSLQQQVDAANARAAEAENQRASDAIAAEESSEALKTTIMAKNRQIAELQTSVASSRYSGGIGKLASVQSLLDEERKKSAKLASEIKQMQTVTADNGRLQSLEQVIKDIAHLMPEIAEMEIAETHAVERLNYAEAALCAAQLRSLQRQVHDLLDSTGCCPEMHSTLAESASHRELSHTKSEIKNLRSDVDVAEPPAGKRFRVICDYEALEDGDLAAAEGDIVVITDQNGEMWTGFHEANPALTGALPNTYLEEI